MFVINYQLSFTFCTLTVLFLIYFVSDCRGDTQLSVFEGDIRDSDFVRKACRGASIVFHVASVIDVKESLEYSEVYGVNVKGKVSASNHSTGQLSNKQVVHIYSSILISQLKYEDIKYPFLVISWVLQTRACR